jgi:cellulose synthase/poly-beta-1,6-N-acetylglucosamine synthase-like glycosyltransferase
MIALFWIAVVAHAAMIINATANLIMFRRTRPSTSEGADPLPFVSVLVPARNEEATIGRLLSSFQQQDHPHAELIVYDDLSEDSTWQIITSHQDDRIRGIEGGPLPDGWVGKVNGCYQLSLAARGEVFLFLDADTEFLGQGALRQMCERYAARPPATILTGVPLLRGKGQLIVSMVGTMILAGMPWWLGKRVPFALMSGVNGQCWMIDRAVYRDLEPHIEVKDQVLEDIMIGRYLHRKGLMPLLDDTRSDLAVYMYSSFGDAWRGFRKNTAMILGPSTVISLLSLSVYTFIFIVAPIFFPWLLLSMYAIKLVTDRTSELPWTTTALAPVSFLLAIVISLDSIVTRALGRNEWKGRRVP